MGFFWVFFAFFIIESVKSIDFKRHEAHKYFLPSNIKGRDVCNNVNCTRNADFETVNFFLFNRQNPEIPFLLNEYNINNVNPSLETKIILHGWNEGFNATWVVDMKNTYLSISDYNIILPDYYFYTSQTIQMGCCYTRSISDVIGYFLVQLTKTVRLDLKKVHVVGASLGAQVGGMVGDAVKIYSGGIKVARITGLDTTYTVFRGRPIADRLTPDDADFVDIIHSNAGQQGYPDPHGHADFYPNCGVTQPQCANETGAIKSLCDHSMSHVFYNRTIYYPTVYAAVECRSCQDYLSGRCNSNRRILMGESTPATSRGIYFLEIYDDLRPLIINAINAGEFDDNPPQSLQDNEVVQQRQDEQDGNVFTTTTTSTENPVYPNPFALSNLNEPGSQYRDGLTGLGRNSDPAGDRMRAEAATSTTTPRSTVTRINSREIPSFMKRLNNNLSYQDLRDFNLNAAFIGAESKNDPYRSNLIFNTRFTNDLNGQELPSNNPSVFNERYLANRFNYSLNSPVGLATLPEGNNNQNYQRNNARTNDRPNSQVSMWRKQSFPTATVPYDNNYGVDVGVGVEQSNGYDSNRNNNQEGTYQFYINYNNKK